MSTIESIESFTGEDSWIAYETSNPLSPTTAHDVTDNDILSASETREYVSSPHTFAPADIDSLLLEDSALDLVQSSRKPSASDDSDSVVYLGTGYGGETRAAPDSDLIHSQTNGAIGPIVSTRILESDSQSSDDYYDSDVDRMPRRKRSVSLTDVDLKSDQNGAVGSIHTADKDTGRPKKKKARRKKKQKQEPTLPPVEELVELNEGDFGPDIEYTVEAILGHKIFRSRVVKYHVKWAGYSDKDNTWEPATQLHEDVPDLCLQYWSRQKVRPINLPAATVDPDELLPEAKDSGQPLPTNRYARRLWESNITNETLLPSFREEGYELAYDQDYPNENTDWRQSLVEIDGMQKHETSQQLLVFCRWANGRKTVHAVEEFHDKVPDILARYYESRVHFED